VRLIGRQGDTVYLVELPKRDGVRMAYVLDLDQQAIESGQPIKIDIPPDCVA